MVAAESKVVSSIDATAQIEVKSGVSEFVTIALFSGIGLLVSLAVVIFDQLTPGDWF
jgi:hypothetical protein